MESAPVEQVDLDLLDAIHKADAPDPGERAPLAEAARRSGLTAKQIALLTDSGALVPVREGRKKLFTADDLGVMALAKRRLDAGIPIEQTVRSFSIYEKALREAVSAEVDDFAAGALMSQNVTAEAGARMIRVSDETLDTFIALAPQGAQRANTARAAWRTWPASSRRSPARWLTMEKALHAAGEEQAMDGLIAAHTGAAEAGAALAEAAAHFWGFANAGGDVARALSEAVRARDYFTALEPSGACALAVACLKAAWLLLAPPVLNCAAAGRARARRPSESARRSPACLRRRSGGIDRPTREVLAWIFSALVAQQRAYFESGATRGADFRLAALKSLREALVKNEALIFEALKADLNQSAHGELHVRKRPRARGDTLPSEAPAPLDEGAPACPRRWRSSTPAASSPRSRMAWRSYSRRGTIPSSSAYRRWWEPSPAGQLRRGQALGLRARPPPPPSPKCWGRRSRGIHRRGRRRPRPEQRPAGRKVRLHLLHRLRRRRQGGDGGRRQTLTPVTLELGGKSPVIVDATADIQLAARPHRLWQGTERRPTCVEPDYLLIHKSVQQPFVEAFRAALKEFFPTGDYANMPTIISEKHYRRLCGLLEGQKIILGGGHDDARRFIEPTLLADVSRIPPSCRRRFSAPYCRCCRNEPG